MHDIDWSYSNILISICDVYGARVEVCKILEALENVEDMVLVSRTLKTSLEKFHLANLNLISRVQEKDSSRLIIRKYLI